MPLAPGTPSILTRALGGLSIGLYLGSLIAIEESLSGASLLATLFGASAAGSAVAFMIENPLSRLADLEEWALGLAGAVCAIATVVVWARALS